MSIIFYVYIKGVQNKWMLVYMWPRALFTQFFLKDTVCDLFFLNLSVMKKIVISIVFVNTFTEIKLFLRSCRDV